MPRLYLFLLFFACAHSAMAQDPATALPPKTLPMDPADLLNCLPVAPADPNGSWKLTRSMGNNSYDNQWLVSHAYRDFSFVPSAPPAASAPKAPQVHVAIIDTAYNPDSNTIFPLDLKGIDKMDSFPSLALGDPKDLWTYVWVGRRFIVSIETVNGDAKTAEKWFKLVATDKLLAAPAPAVAVVPRPYVARHVNELDPAGNVTGKGYYTTPEDMQKLLESEAAYAKKLTAKQPPPKPASAN